MKIKRNRVRFNKRDLSKKEKEGTVFLTKPDVVPSTVDEAALFSIECTRAKEILSLKIKAADIRWND